MPALSVHLLGRFPGPCLHEDEPEKTYPLEQVRIALEHAPSQLILLPEFFDPDEVEEESYTAFPTGYLWRWQASSAAA